MFELFQLVFSHFSTGKQMYSSSKPNNNV